MKHKRQLMQIVTPELRAWIIAQATAGHAPETVLKSMLASGWNEDSAVDALEKTLASYLEERNKQAVLPPVVKVPEPMPSGSRTVIWAGDREVQVLVSLMEPRLVVFGSIFSDDECDEMIELSRPKLARSQTVLGTADKMQNDTNPLQIHETRTSEGMFFSRAEHALITRLETRIAALLAWPIENGEGLQVLRYGPGAEYKPHYDYFNPAHSDTVGILKRGGQRVASLVCYLNTPAQGGATVFPDLKLDVAPLKGNAVFFSYDRPHPATRTLHGGAPVVEGEKWVATKWLRERPFN
jgi:prolyl 4-hydroxylase